MLDKISPFEEELGLICDPRVRRFVEDCLELSPDYFFKVAASDTGKHHPYWALGEGGTVRHTRAVAKVGLRLAGTFVKDIDTLRVDLLIAAALLHDSHKYGISFDTRYYPLHPYIPRTVFGRITSGLTGLEKDWIFKAIESHMGSYINGGWSPLYYVTKGNLKDDPMALALHLADYIVADLSFIDKRFADVSIPLDGVYTQYEAYPDEAIKGIILGVMLSCFGSLPDNYLDTLDIVFNRVVSNLRYPSSVRGKKYNYEGIIKCATEHLLKIVGKEGVGDNVELSNSTADTTAVV